MSNNKKEKNIVKLNRKKTSVRGKVSQCFSKNQRKETPSNNKKVK